MTKRILQVVGFKNSGKTTFCCRLIKEWTKRGLRVGAIKHDGHDFTFDQTGTDSWKLGQAGADPVSVTSASQTASFSCRPSTLADLISTMDEVDLILVEGFKHEHHPKVVLIKTKEEWQQLRELDQIIAVITRVPLGETIPYPLWSVENQEKCLEYLLRFMGVESK
ncbi:MAG: molybdopterin-guanine dinucleotide biosynthesis protein B [Thermoactinomyces sp.]